MQTNVSLEEELRKANAAKGQLETYKRQVPALLQSAKGVRFPINDTGCSPPPPQVVELQNRLSEESKKADKMEFEYKRVKEKVDSLQKEKDVRLSFDYTCKRMPQSFLGYTKIEHFLFVYYWSSTSKDRYLFVFYSINVS